MPHEDITHFTTVDQTGDPAFFTRFLEEANRNRSIIGSKPVVIDGLRLRGTERVLDVGCGTGQTFSSWPLPWGRAGTSREST